eukprot:3933750-Rhodomonas_salina.1
MVMHRTGMPEGEAKEDGAYQIDSEPDYGDDQHGLASGGLGDDRDEESDPGRLIAMIGTVSIFQAAMVRPGCLRLRSPAHWQQASGKVSCALIAHNLNLLSLRSDNHSGACPVLPAASARFQVGGAGPATGSGVGQGRASSILRLVSRRAGRGGGGGERRGCGVGCRAS